MSEKQYKAVSPGVEFREIDNSQLPAVFDETGPVVIGRAERGPAMVPVRVNSYAEFVEFFGNPNDNLSLADVWREGVTVGPSYGALAAQASLANKSALTFVRLLGVQHDEATDAGKAGWGVGGTGDGAGLDYSVREGGAYGLFLMPSATHPTTVATGTLAAIFYLSTGSIMLHGQTLGTTAMGAGYITSGTALIVESDANKQFRIIMKNSSNVTVEDIVFSMDKSSNRFIRKVFNTNPTKINSDLYASPKTYFLGETFEDFIYNSDEMTGMTAASKWVGVILGMKNNSTGDTFSSRRLSAQHGRTGWYFSQDMGNYATFQVDNVQKLFKLHSRDSGEWNQSHIKISIRNVEATTNPYNPYGTFDVLIRKIDDTDANIVIIEQFNNCDLNPVSDNYIAKKIGDKYTVFSTSDRRNLEYGRYDNSSKYIRVEMNEDVDAGATVPELLPFGVYGPVKIENFNFCSGSLVTDYNMAGGKFGKYTGGTGATLLPQTFTGAFVLGSSSIADFAVTGSMPVSFGAGTNVTTMLTGAILTPYPRLRVSTLTGALGNPKNAFFGVFTDDSSDRFQKAVRDLTNILPLGVDSFTPSEAEGTAYSWKFTLDDLKYVSGGETDVQWTSGSRQAGTSITSIGSNNWNSVLTGGWDSFTTLLAGGFDGFDITEIEPLRNDYLGSSPTEKTNYVYNSINRAIELLQYPELVEFSEAAIPGVYKSALTRRLIEVCAQRGDALAVIDLENDYQPRSENSDSEASRRPIVSTTISALKDRALNTNYACAYFPWVQGIDPNNNLLTYMPPSVVALGAFAYTDKVAGSHHAPAGFERGALSLGHGGIPVKDVTLKLLQKDRDDLYKANINPISFLEREVVIMGQKTLQAIPSALDRINVRRGLLTLRKKFSKIAARLVFEPNVQDTWDRFTNKAEPILRDMVARLGLDDWKLVLDTRTTTPDLIDRNIIYGRVFLKPTRTAEFFYLDFNISNSGAAFAEV